MKTRRILFIIGCLCWFSSISLVYKYDKQIQKRYTIYNKYTQISGKSGQIVTYYFYLGNNEEKEVTRVTYNSFNTGDWVAFKDHTNEYENWITWLTWLGGISLFISLIMLLDFS
jgi:hypothetical protein